MSLLRPRRRTPCGPPILAFLFGAFFAVALLGTGYLAGAMAERNMCLARLLAHDEPIPAPAPAIQEEKI